MHQITGKAIFAIFGLKIRASLKGRWPLLAGVRCLIRTRVRGAGAGSGILRARRLGASSKGININSEIQDEKQGEHSELFHDTSIILRRDFVACAAASCAGSFVRVEQFG